ncbi:Cysteine-rich repeat secretory protein 55 [Apostasia shenzhenica]|uniref:Cysteine-rich repeat secretory protein 55 n=1 Tax=Apostasia shenzhenica TaxID=1088818 RepID=A0A2H9ZWN1_9ASPA|nr:Cysteine-rich repeat secretory protein 55 [Apostasia shenzhenica]
MKKEQCPLKLLMRLIDGDNCIVRYKVGNQTIDRDNAPDLDFRVYQSPVRVPSHYWEYFNSVVGMEIRLLVRLVPSQWDGYLKRARKIHLNRRMALNSLGQCPRNLSESACDRCMKAAMEALLQACPGQDACGVVSSSCILKYSTSEVM